MAASSSHSPKPGPQGEISHAPLTQICDAKLQVFVQVPQWRGSLSVLVSQPLLGSPSQSVCAASHVGEHTPALQLVSPWALLQLTAHSPQCATVFRSVSQPLTAMPSQSAKPAAHEGAHKPSAQVASP
jgi:hypothetical protein